MNKFFTKIAALSVGLAMAVGVGVAVGSKEKEVEHVVAAVEERTMDKKFSFSDLTSVSNAAAQSDHWRLNKSATCVVNTLSFSSAEVPTTDVVFTFEVATYSTGSTPAPKITISGTETNSTWNISNASLSSNPTSSTYVYPTVTIPISGITNPTAFAGFNLSIKTDSGRQVRFKSVEVVFKYNYDSSLPSISLNDTSATKIKVGENLSISANLTNYSGAVAWSASPSSGVSFSTSTATTSMSIDSTVALGTVITVTASISNGEYSTPTGKKVVAYAHTGTSVDAFEADEACGLIKYGLFDEEEDSYYVTGFVKRTSGASYYNTWISTSKNNSEQADNNCVELYGPTAGSGVSLSNIAAGKMIAAHGKFTLYGSQPEMTDATIDSITAVTVTSVSVTGTPTKQYVGQDFDYSGLSFTANYSDSSTESVNGADIEWPELTKGNNQTIVGSYDNIDVNVTGVNVVDDTFTTLTLSGSITTSYKVTNTSWNTSGLSVSANYEGKGDTDVTSLVTWNFSVVSPQAMGVTESATELSISASYNNVTSNSLKFNVTVAAFDGYEKVVSASDLEVGATYFMASSANNAIASSTISSGYLTNLTPGNSDGEFSSDKSTFDGSLPSGTLLFSVIKDGDDYYLVQLSSDKSLKRSSSTKFAWTTVTDLSDSSSAWSITFLKTTTYGNYEIGAKSTGHILYNKNSPRYKPYTSDPDSGMLYPELFKKVGSKYNTEVLEFNSDWLHMDDPDYDGDTYSGTDPDVNCADNYEYMKIAYSELTVFAKSVLQYHSNYSDARARMNAWAVANGETFTYGAETPFESIRINPMFDDSSSNAVTIIVVISIVSLTAVGGYFLFKKKKEQ